MSVPTNPFDATDLTNIYEARHIFAWYTRLSPYMRQRCVDTVVNDTAVIEFIKLASEHAQHSDDFDRDALTDLMMRMKQKLGQS